MMTICPRYWTLIRRVAFQFFCNILTSQTFTEAWGESSCVWDRGGLSKTEEEIKVSKRWKFRSFFLFFFWAGLRDHVACSLLGGGIPIIEQRLQVHYTLSMFMLVLLLLPSAFIALDPLSPPSYIPHVPSSYLARACSLSPPMASPPSPLFV